MSVSVSSRLILDLISKNVIWDGLTALLLLPRGATRLLKIYMASLHGHHNMPYTITLTETEMRSASLVGIERQMDSMRKGSKDSYGFQGNPWGNHVLGALGEKAVAKLLRVYWDESVGTYNEGYDVGNYQVRTSASHYAGMTIRHRDNDRKKYILVTGTGPTFRIHGWMYAGEAKRHPEWLEDKQNRGSPAFFVPQSALHPLEELPELSQAA